MEQTEDPASVKGIVRREVVQIVTPGTVLTGSLLNEKENNYIASVFSDEHTMGLAYCDVSTGEIYSTDISGAGRYENLLNELVKIDAREDNFRRSNSTGAGCGKHQTGGKGVF